MNQIVDNLSYFEIRIINFSQFEVSTRFFSINLKLVDNGFQLFIVCFSYSSIFEITARKYVN